MLIVSIIYIAKGEYMPGKDHRLTLLWIILTLVLLVSRSDQHTAHAAPIYLPYDSHGITIHNAQEQKVDPANARGVRADISWTDPPLNGGLWVYNRVAVLKIEPFAFVEFGPQKDIVFGRRGLIVWNDGARHEKVVSITAATHRYSIQYNASTSKYDFFLDGAYVYSANPGFTSGIALGGGEVATGGESMYSTYLSNLRFLKKQSDGTWKYSPWNGHKEWFDDPPYVNIDAGLNAFYDFGN
jgi:hypothetical protein